MRIRLLFLSLVLIVVGITASAQAQAVFSLDTAGSPRTLTLQECLDMAQVGNIGLQRTRLGVDISLLNRIKAESVFDPGFELDLTGNHGAGGGSSGGGTSVYDLAMHYRLPTDQGSAWVFSLDQSRSNGTTTVAGSPTAFTAYSSQVGVGFSFPLMQGSEERINRLGIDQADIAVLRSEAAVNNAARNLRNGIIQAYIGAVLNERQIEVAQLSLDTAKNLVEQTQARIDVGLLAPYELLAAESGLAEREEAILNAQAALKTSLDSLKALIGIPITDEIQLDEGILQALSLDVDPDQLFYEAQQNRPDYLDIDLQVRQAQLTLLAAQDRTRASLVWSTQLHLSGQDTGYLRSLGDLNSFAWSTGLQYKIPLGGNRAAVADESTAEINLQQLQLEKVDFLRGLERDIRSAVVDLNSALLRMDVTAQGLHVQEVKMESERARLDLGLNKARDFLQFDLDLANARIAYYSAMGDAYLAVGRLESLVNENLLDRITVIGGTSEPSVEVPK